MTKISDSILYIGTSDTDIQLFERQYPTPCGMQYNSYIIDDEKIAIMDTADQRMAAQWLDNLHTALSGREPDYLVMHHIEPDHSALALQVLVEYPNMKIVGTQKLIQMLPQFFEGIDLDGRTIAVKEGDRLSLGKHSLRFIMAPMVHWPEVMVSYEESEEVVFSADAFGTFGTIEQQEEDWACEARRYYFNICGKYGVPVQNLLKKLGSLKIQTICPLHGPVLSDNLQYYIDLYNTWSRYEAEKDGVFIGYASIHGGTKAVAQYVDELLRSRGIKTCLMDLTEEEVSFAVEDAFAYPKTIFAASSYDAGLFPPMHNLLHHLQQKAWQNKTVALIENGSWAPSAGKVMKEILAGIKDVRVLDSMVTIRSRMKEQDKALLENLVDALISA